MDFDTSYHRFIEYNTRLVFAHKKIKTPGKGIYLVFNLVKTRVSKGKPNPVLKIPAQLIPEIFLKHGKKNFWKSFIKSENLVENPRLENLRI